MVRLKDPSSAALAPPPSADVFLDLFPPPLRLIGEDYVGLGRLSHLMVAGSSIAGAVSGERHDYWVVLTKAGAHCSHCSRLCRHGAAVAAAWQRAPGDFVDILDLTARLMQSQDSAPLVAGLLEDRVLDALLAFTDLPFIPPSEPRQELARLDGLSPADQAAALFRLLRGWGEDPLLVTEALQRLPGLPLVDLADIALLAPESSLLPLGTLLASRLDDDGMAVFLDRVLVHFHDLRSRRQDVSALLLRAARILAMRPGDTLALAYLAGLPEAPPALSEVAAELAVLAASPRQALLLLDQTLLTAQGDDRLRLYVRAAEIARSSGSAREAALWLAALKEGSAPALAQLTLRFPQVLRAARNEVVAALSATNPDLACQAALAARDQALAFSLAQRRSLSLPTLRRLLPLARSRQVDPAGWSLGRLTAQEQLRFTRLCQRPIKPRVKKGGARLHGQR